MGGPALQICPIYFGSTSIFCTSFVTICNTVFSIRNLVFRIELLNIGVVWSRSDKVGGLHGSWPPIDKNAISAEIHTELQILKTELQIVTKY